ncbi:MAG: EAL domain-containing protein [Methylobacteriaceae bacterium]|nr:EAL domain-containing protein [Methylobacteriaceae bacterium]
MELRRVLSTLLRTSHDSPELLRARHAALQTQVPLLYLILVVNTLLLAAAHWQTASAWLTAAFPLALTIVCVRRGLMWVRSRACAETPEAMGARLRQTALLGGALGVLFVAWALALYRHGDATQQGHVIFFVGITSICCVMCLMHLPVAALAVTGAVAAPFATFLILFGEPGVAAIAVNLLIVLGTLIYLLYSHNRDFTTLVATQEAMAHKREEAQRLSDENHRLANLDSLTDLANRRSFFAVLSQLIAARKATVEPLYVGLVDLDGFKPVNDTYGHTAGDDILRQVGRRLQGLACDKTSYARLGGDEFALIIRADPTREELTAFGQRLCAALAAPYRIGDMTIEISATVGFARYPDAAETVETLYERADYALYHAKQNHRGGMTVFSTRLHRQFEKAKTIEQALSRADLQAELSLEFQPIFDVEADRLVALEALARWNSPQLGRVPPDKFIPVAERSALIHRVTLVLLGKALTAARDWPAQTQLSFNLSVRDLTSREAIRDLVALIEQSGFPASRLVIEITESALMRDYEVALESLAFLKALGVEISLDDFGTGYSSLSRMHRLPLDKIKIDRSFVRELAGHHPTRDVIRTILALCDNLRLSCIVEGMETSAEVEILRELGCRKMQGFYFARPMPAQDVGALFAGRRAQDLRPAAA